MSAFSTFKACLGKSAGSYVLANQDLSWLIQDFLENPKQKFQKELVKSQNILVGSIDVWTKKIMNLIESTRDRFAFDSLEYQLWDTRYESEQVLIVLNQPTMMSSGKMFQFGVGLPFDNIGYMDKLYYTFCFIYRRSIVPEIDKAELIRNENKIDKMLKMKSGRTGSVNIFGILCKK